MQIIISPAKKMRNEIDYLQYESIPVCINKTKQILEYIQTKSISDLQYILKCNQKIASEAYYNYMKMDLYANLVPALLAYDGIQYNYMAPHIFEYDDFDYATKHLRILSGFYGILKPLDGVKVYRLELNNPFKTDFCNSLYEFWQDDIYSKIVNEDNVILDLCSVQYSKLITKYLDNQVTYVKCYFMEEEHETFKEKGVYVKIARGEMVRYLIKNKINSLEKVKLFNELGYSFNKELSNENKYVFTRKEK